MPGVPARSQAEPLVDVVVPTHNTCELTMSCVESVLELGDPGEASPRCVVVDNASTDGTADAVERRWPQTTVVRNSANAGFASACNQGARAGSGEFVLFLNSDTVAQPGAVSRLAAYLAAQPGFAAAGAKLVHAGTQRAQVGFAVRALPTLSAQLALILGLERVWPGNPVSRRQLMLDFDYDRTQEAEQPAGACLMCRREAFEAVGGFDEGFHYWFEDVDLVRRLRRHGRIAYVHDAVFEHVGGATFETWHRAEVIASRYPSLFRYFDKHHPCSERVALRVVAGALAAMRAAAWAPFDGRRAAAYLEVMRLALAPMRGAKGRR